MGRSFEAEVQPGRFWDRWHGFWYTVGLWRRSRTHGLRTLACALLILVLCGVVGLAALEGRSDLDARYLVQAQQHFEQERWDQAALSYRRVLWSAPGNPQARIGLALVAEQQGDLPRAMSLMDNVAQGGSELAVAAHRWIAEKLLQVRPEPSPAQLLQAQTHLERAAASSKDDLALRELLGKVYVRRGLLQKAAEQYRAAAGQQPRAYLAMAALYRQLGQTAEADSAAGRAIQAFQALLNRDPTDVAARQALAAAHVMKDELDEAETLLAQGLKLAPDPSLRLALANLNVLRFQRAIDDPQTPFRDKLTWLTNALQLVPQHPDAMASLAHLTAGQGAEGETAQKELRAALAEGQAPAIVHMILGTIASDRGDLKQAAFHFEQALAIDPRMPAVANNLAWVLFQADKSNADRALELTNQAIERSPDDAELRATRGVIRLHQGQVREAIVDLEFALQREPNRPDLHESLADAYEKLGDADLAAQHRELSKPSAKP